MSGTVQAIVDDHYLGRVSSVLSLVDVGLMPLALLGFGGLTTVTGLGPACLIYGIAFAALMVFALSRPHIAHLRPRQHMVGKSSDVGVGRLPVR